MFILFLLILCPFISIAQPSSLTNPTVNARTYLPGDFVHVIVQAPVDTSQITAIMPDGTPVTLIQDRRTNVWRGLWQVPIDFKKETYSANLTAVDVQGNVFTGQTDYFSVGELAMITLVGKPTPEAAPKPPLRQIITAEAAPATVAGQEELISLIKKIITPPAGAPAPELTLATKNRLVERNLAAGKEDIQQGKLSEAAAFFRIVLYLAPDNKEAGTLLADTQNRLAAQKKIQAEGARRFYLMIVAIIFAVLIVLAALIYFLIRAIPRGIPTQGKSAKLLSDKEKTALWLNQTGWTKNPFSLQAIQQLFAGESKLELDGLKNYLKTRIEEAGGKGFDPFTDAALEKVYTLSKGNPKTALKICDWSVGQAIRRSEFSITAELVKGYELIGLTKILIADDEEIIRSSLDAILRKGGGYETDFALDGEEALKKIKENLYGLVLLDIEMPKLDGYTVLKEARALYPELPIMFVTGKGRPQKTIESMAQYNLNGYIEKPFTPEKVLDVVARVIKK